MRRDSDSNMNLNIHTTNTRMILWEKIEAVMLMGASAPFVITRQS
jgi:hypothetical protein